MDILTAGEGDPAGVLGGVAVPVGGDEEATGEGEGDDAHNDEEQRDHPLGREPRRDAGPLASVDGLALPHQAHRQSTCGVSTAPNQKQQSQILSNHNAANANACAVSKITHYALYTIYDYVYNHFAYLRRL